jgi:hypothetical protein
LVKKTLIILITGIFFYSCGKGISPEPEGKINTTGFGGIVIFTGTWPAGIARTLIVAFKNPLNSSGDFNAFNLGFVSDTIPYGINSIFYSSLKNPLLEILPGEYSYIAVAQSRTPAISLNRIDWTVVGVYYANSDYSTPGKLIISKDEFVPNINITCDFDNPPPQPPGGE